MNPEIIVKNNNVVIITLIIIAIMTGAVIYWEILLSEKQKEKGCTPITPENRSLIPTRWKCN